MSKRVFIVMGVSGCGKTSVAHYLASEHKTGLIEGDDLHTDSAKQKMADGVPLNDVDRVPWLTAIVAHAQQQLLFHDYVVISCSSLKKRYRDRLRHIAHHVYFIYLVLPQAIAISRVESREQHFFPKGMVQSQYTALQEPQRDEHYIKSIDGTQALHDVYQQASDYVMQQINTDGPIL